jgi:hypothetical protein
LKHAEKVIYPIIISEEVKTSGEVRERIKETVKKTRGRKGQEKENNKEKRREW